MPEVTFDTQFALPLTVTFCGRPGKLTPIAEPAADTVASGDNPVGADGCWVWRTDEGFLRAAVPAQGSLLGLACDVAELYHQHCTLQLSDLPGERLEVIWLELAADNSLLVFLKPVVQTTHG